MAKRMLIDALHEEETRVVIADENQIYDFDFVSSSKKQLKGNIYLAKITRVEPSLQAAFVEYGGGKQGFLPFSEIHTDYYQIPMSDRMRLMQEQESEQEDATPENAQESSFDSVQPDDQAQTSSEENMNEPSLVNSALPLAPAIEELPDSVLENDDRPVYAHEATTDNAISQEVPLPSDIIEPRAEAAHDIMANGAFEAAEAITDSSNAEQRAVEGVETIENEEEEIQNRRQKNRFSRRYKIQEVIRRGQVVLIQVIKEERGNKGASLTTFLSLAGRYCVLMPNSPKDGGISRKIASSEDRKRLKAISTELRLAQGMSVIIRTAGMDRTRAEIKRDYDYLVKLWNRIREDTLKSNAPALIYEESDVIKRAIRDQYTNDIDEVVIEGDEGYKAAKDFMKLLLPSHTPKIKHHKEPTPLFYAYDIEDQLLSMHDETVKLKSGGYIVINPTEALISIDVNSGRATGERNIEETASKTNLEAAVEVARQLRLRDLAGLIVIDFIDMLDSRNRRAVERTLKDALKMDRAKIQLGRISPFGLLEMSRQRLRPSISETNMVQCLHCVGRGYIRSNESMSIQMIRALEKEAASGSWSGLRLIAPQQVALHLLNTKSQNLRIIEERNNLTIQVLIDTSLSTSDYNLEKMRRSGGERSQQNSEPRRGRNRERVVRLTESAPIVADSILEEMRSDNSYEQDNNITEVGSGDNNSSADSELKQGDRKRRSRRGRRGGKLRNDRPERIEVNDANPPLIEQSQQPDNNDNQQQEFLPPQQNSEESNNTRGNRGGRRRWRDRGGKERNTNNNGGWPTNDNAAEAPMESTALPAFAVNDPVPMEVPASAYRNEEPKIASAAVQSTPRDPNAPVKKGWWQKMIELDD